MSYIGYVSTFQPMVDAIGTVHDPQDAESSHHLKLGVAQMLADRFREETEGDEDGPFRVDFARARILGCLQGADGRKGLERLRQIAVAQGACPDFVEAVDLVITAARAALAEAPAKVVPEAEPQKPDASHADWTRAKVPNPDMVELPDLSDI
ncbi:MAG: hypothetical protein ABI548_03925 [Polyangiaceae bacterium]